MEGWVLLMLFLSWAPAVLARPAPSDTVFYQCNDTGFGLAVKMDPLSAGSLLLPQYLTLGWCGYSTLTDLPGFVVFEYALTDCGFSRLTSGMMVNYFADLVYSPPAGTSGRSYSTAFSEQINCTSYHLIPAPSTSYPVMSQLSSSGVLNFQANLMNADFSAPSGTRVYGLGSSINIELSVLGSFHLPMLLYIDQCKATLSPDPTTLTHSIINNYGCLIDGRGADSKFVARPSPSRIRLTLQAFRFAVANSDVYLHFQLLVWDPNVLTDATRKACSYFRDSSRWELLDNPSASSVCACCESNCPAPRIGRGLKEFETSFETSTHTVSVGPLHVSSDPRTGSYEWNMNRTLAINELKEHRAFGLPPAIGALLMEAALLGLVFLGVHLYQRGKASAGLDATGETETSRLVLEEEKSDAQ
ncbi:zona pellucida sperm-binding protein 3-like isoform X2 [Ambystoma mexicanum]|uniref:zona pellucida sperm-binding protein 3-like isoform X2 n=1 Tax=Ambystoma mexicanum TaxID=8296 RepID=UPI0037E8F712